jgi:hypothetical protein
MPFSPSEKDAIQAQALQATILANHPFQVFEDAEVIKLFWMMRMAALSILPSAKVIGGSLLNDVAVVVEKKMDKILQGKNVGLK